MKQLMKITAVSLLTAMTTINAQAETVHKILDAPITIEVHKPKNKIFIIWTDSEGNKLKLKRTLSKMNPKVMSVLTPENEKEGEKSTPRSHNIDYKYDTEKREISGVRIDKMKLNK